MTIQNIASYCFVPLNSDELPSLRQRLFDHANANGIRGSILLATEGINLILAGWPEPIRQFTQFLTTLKPFEGMKFKTSFSANYPFNRLFVKIKQEIVTLKQPQIKPHQRAAAYLAPTTFKQWYDEERSMLVLDTRNKYEVALGHFKNAVDLQLTTFSEFSHAVDQLLPQHRDTLIISYCTGGIRCEKAAVLMLEKGFKCVYQLEGGILSYFESCGGAHYEGKCFVFDHRIAVNSCLRASS